MRKTRFAALLAGLLILAGCSKRESVPIPEGEKDKKDLPVSSLGKANLSGKVTFKGEAVVAGRLFFFAKEGLVPVAGVIKSDGTYEVKNLPEGELTVCVLTDPSGNLP